MLNILCFEVKHFFNYRDPSVQVIEALPGQHVVIRVKKINSTVNVRKVGK